MQLFKRKYLIISLLQFFYLNGFSQQKMPDGIFGSDFRHIRTGNRSYFTSISFKFKTDSFFYWHGEQYGDKTGVGTYKMHDKKLYLKFENSGVQNPRKSIAKILPDLNSPQAAVSVINFSSCDFEGNNITGSSVVIKTASGDSLTKSFMISTDLRSMNFTSADFPLTIKGLYAAYLPVEIEVPKPGNYDVKMYFQKYGDERLCNGEVWIYNIIKQNDDEITLQKINESSNENKPQNSFIYPIDRAIIKF